MKSFSSAVQNAVLLYFIPVLSLLFSPALTSHVQAVDVRFGVFTDTHTYYSPVKFPDKYENAEYKLVPILNKFKEVNQSVGLPFVIHLGDLYEDHVGVGTAQANIPYTEGYFDRYSCRLLSSDCFDIYLAIGNHDSNMSSSGVDRSYVGTNLSS
ncbi:MAG: metallophosphoesterase [Nitrospirae bacterium]|nr:metallophosphoesterase [Nitrospirota bacterium]